MDREEARKAIRREKDTLQQSLMDETGTPEEMTQWLARLEELDPEHFDDFDCEYRDHIEVTRRARALKAKLSDPISKAGLAAMVRNIRVREQERAAMSDDDFVDYQADYHLLCQANPDANWAALISEADPTMTAEEIVDIGSAQERHVIAMPGPSDEHQLREQKRGG